MAKWLFFEDSGLQQDEHQGINLNAVSNLSLRMEDLRIILFYSGRGDPHALTFKTKEQCQVVYDKLKELLQE